MNRRSSDDRKRSKSKKLSLAERLEKTSQELKKERQKSRGLAAYIPAFISNPFGKVKGLFTQGLGAALPNVVDCETAAAWLNNISDLLKKWNSIEWVLATFQPLYTNAEFNGNVALLKQRLEYFFGVLTAQVQQAGTQQKGCLSLETLYDLQAIERTTSVLYEQLVLKQRSILRDITDQYFQELKGVASKNLAVPIPQTQLSYTQKQSEPVGLNTTFISPQVQQTGRSFSSTGGPLRKQPEPLQFSTTYFSANGNINNNNGPAQLPPQQFSTTAYSQQQSQYTLPPPSSFASPSSAIVSNFL